MHIILKKFSVAARTAVWPISISLLLCFLLYAAIYATSMPLCCADDASIAVVSKNLASGLGYLSTVNYWGSDSDYYGVLFDPGISTGVTSVVPVAIGIYLFGPLASLPGLVHIVLYAILFAVLLFYIRTVSGKVVAGGVLALFVVLIASTSAYHFEHWYAQLGEVLAALLVILGAAVLGLSPPGYRAYFVAGLLMGGAFLTKQLAALYIAGVFGVVLLEVLRAPRPERAFKFQLSLILFVGVCAPILCFELWKIWVLGLGGWIENWQKLFKFMLQAGIGGKQYESMAYMVWDRLHTVHQRFFVSPYALILLLVSYPFLFFSLPVPLRRFSAFLLFGFVLHVVYWLGWSIGWPRYVYIAVIVGGLLLSIAQVAGQGRASRVLLGAAIVIIVLSGLPKISWRYPIDARMDGPSRSAQIVASYIELKYQQDLVHTQWWAHTSALEYLSSIPHRYSNWNEPRNLSLSNRLIVINSKFLNENDTNFISLLADSCRIEISHGVYTLFSCREVK